MRKLILKLIMLLVIALGLFMIPEYLSMKASTVDVATKITNSEDFNEATGGIASICPSIERARDKDDANVLVIGDSIAGQMFNGLDDPACGIKVCCTNAAINITGQYMIAMEFLDSHPEATDIWLYMHPLTLIRDYDLEMCYFYGVMPFVNSGSIHYLDDVTIKEMSSVYGSYALNREFVLLIDKSPLNRKLFFGYLRINGKEFDRLNVYETSSMYIEKLAMECQLRGVNFHFYSSPSTEYFRNRIEETRSDFEKSHLSEMYPTFLDDIYYFPTEWSEDMTHFGGDYANRETYDGVINEAYDEIFMDFKEG